MSEPITNYSSEQRKYVPEQYKRSTKLLGVIDSALGFSDELEKALREISDNFNIEDAVGPMLDFYGAYAGEFTRRVGETDDQFRARIRLGTGTEDLPTFEGIYNYFKIVLDISDIILCPVWPAGIYFILGQGITKPDIDEVKNIAAASGVDFGEGTFLVAEYGEPYGLVVSEDTGMPFVIDQGWPEQVEYAMVNDEDNLITNSSDEVVIGTDYF